MIFTPFAVSTTNIFPASNTKNGGQLLTEFNLRSRESVSTPEAVKYMIGPSFVHSSEDFYVSAENTTEVSDAGRNPCTFRNPSCDKCVNCTKFYSGTRVNIAAGRGVINGHFVQSLATVSIDIAEANKQILENNVAADSDSTIARRSELQGVLCVGLKMAYSDEALLSGTLKTEVDKNNSQYSVYAGVQVVVLPSSQFKLPEDVPDDQTEVTAHIKLAEITYRNGTIQCIVNNYPKKCQCLAAGRISDVDQLLSEHYISKDRLDPDRLYVFSGRGDVTSDGKRLDTFRDATSSLMAWIEQPSSADNPTKESFAKNVTHASFEADGKQGVYLQIPFMSKVNSPTPKYYMPLQLDIPSANFGKGTAGVVTEEYTKRIKAIRNMVNTIRQTIGNNQITYIDELTDRANLPPLDQSWEVGDYIIVAQDRTIDLALGDAYDISTMYVIMPGKVNELEPIAEGSNSRYRIILSNDVVRDTTKLLNGSETSSLGGVELDVIDASFDESDLKDAEGTAFSPWNSSRKLNTKFIAFVRERFRELKLLENNVYFGRANKDYVTYAIKIYSENSEGTSFCKYEVEFYIPVVSAASKSYPDYPVLLTSQIPLADEGVVGGFLNIDEGNSDAGYVYRDEEGHLRLLDYDLLRSGTLAYQLGEDQQNDAGIDNTRINEWLNEYVNQRIAFITSPDSSDTANVVNVVMKLSNASADDPEITVKEIDSRFGTAVVLTLTGAADSNTVINIYDCEKIRIRLSPSDGNSESLRPVINLYRSCLYYDPNIINMLNEVDGMTLWYEKFNDTDPNIQVDGMTVTLMERVTEIETLEFWTNVTPNDNTYKHALKSLTFNSNGRVVGCELYIKCDVTGNLSWYNGKYEVDVNPPGRSIYMRQYSLPSTAGFTYPKSKIENSIQINGSFFTGYCPTDKAGNSTNIYVLIETKFTAESQHFVKDRAGNIVEIPGKLAIFADVSDVPMSQVVVTANESDADGKIQTEVTSTYSADIDAFHSAYHVFHGSVIGTDSVSN